MKPMIVLIIDHFSISAQFREILRKYRNFVEKNKLLGLKFCNLQKTVGPSDNLSSNFPE